MNAKAPSFSSTMRPWLPILKFFQFSRQFYFVLFRFLLLKYFFSGKHGMEKYQICIFHEYFLLLVFKFSETCKCLFLLFPIFTFYLSSIFMWRKKHINAMLSRLLQAGILLDSYSSQSLLLNWNFSILLCFFILKLISVQLRVF